MSKTVIRKEQCEDCQDTGQDNKAVYEDGSAYCFSCNKLTEGNDIEVTKKVKQEYALLEGEYCNLKTRCLTKESCEKYGVQVGSYCGDVVLIFNRYKNGELVRQKLRSVDKKFWWTGKDTEMDMFGSQNFDDPKEKNLVITEGEIDAVSVYQALDRLHTYHVTSLDSGAGDVKKWVNTHYEQLIKYKSIVVCFDNDEVGNKAKDTFLKSFTFGLIRVVKLPLKDANEMLQQGRSNDLKWAVIKSEPYKPSNVVTVRDIKEKALQKPESGRPWPWQGWNEVTYGMRPAVYVVFGPEGTGKTEVIKEIAFNNLSTSPEMLSAIFSFEHEPEESLQRLTASKLNKRIYIPDTEWDEQTISNEMDAFEDKIYWYKYTGVLRFEEIVKSIYYLANVKDVKFFCLDNLTAMTSYPYIDGKRCSEAEYLGYVINVIKQIQKELKLVIVVITHNSNDNMSKQVYVSTSPKNTDEYLNRSSEDQQQFINRPGTTWESGRVATLENIHGSSIIKKVVDYIIVLARNRVSTDDMEHRTIKCKFLKCRLDSKYEGKEVKLLYTPDDGRLIEIFSGTSLSRNVFENLDGVM